MKILLIFLFMLSQSIFAKSASLSSTLISSDPFYLLFFLIFVSLLPFVAVMTTSFAKIIIILSIVRQALGTSQAPPNLVLISLALVLTIFSMYPVLRNIEDNLTK